MLRFLAVACALLLGVLLGSGCSTFADREPMPVIQVVTNSDGLYQVNGRMLTGPQVRAYLTEVANKNRRNVTRHGRVIVRLSTGPGADYSMTTQVVEWAQEAGIQNIERVP